MPRYKLRTLLIVLAIGPPLLAGLWFLIRTPWFPIAWLPLAIGVLAIGAFVPIAALLGLACVAIDAVLRLLRSRHRLPTVITLVIGGPILIACLTAFAVWAKFFIAGP